MPTSRDREMKKIRYANAKEMAEKHEKSGFVPTTFKCPSGVNLFRFKEAKTYKLDFLPYEAGEGNPRCDKGLYTYERTYWAHGVPTPEGVRNFVCAWRVTDGKKRCAVCDEMAALRKAGTMDSESIDALKAKERQLFNIIDLDAKDDGIQVFEFNYFQLGKQIDGLIDIKEKYASFFHLEDGFTLETKVTKDSYNGKTVWKPTSFIFEARKDYPDDILSKTHCLDDLLIVPSYEKLKSIIRQEPEAESNGHEEKVEVIPKRAAKARVEVKEEEETGAADEAVQFAVGDWVTYEDEDYEVMRINPATGFLRLRDRDGGLKSGVDPSEVELAEPPEKEEEKPSPKSSKRGGTSSSKPDKEQKKPPKKEEPKDPDLEEDEDEDFDSDFGDEDEDE